MYPQKTSGSCLAYILNSKDSADIQEVKLKIHFFIEPKQQTQLSQGPSEGFLTSKVNLAKSGSPAEVLPR